MISVTQLRNGATFLLDDQPYKVLSYKHTHLSRGAGTIRVKIRNLKTGAVLDKGFKSGERFEEVDMNRKRLQFLYRDGEECFFMDPLDFSQVSVPVSIIGEGIKFLVDGDEYTLFSWQNPVTDAEEVLDLELPPKLDFEVVEAAPGVKGDTQSGGQKDAVLANGLRVKVPLFIKKGDRVRVDTRDGSYVERA